jgi:hypothetical protein
MDVLLLREHASTGMCLPSRCLAMGLYDTLYILFSALSKPLYGFIFFHLQRKWSAHLKSEQHIPNLDLILWTRVRHSRRGDRLITRPQPTVGCTTHKYFSIYRRSVQNSNPNSYDRPRLRLRGYCDRLKTNAIEDNDSWLTQQLNNRNNVTDISFQQMKSTCVRPPIK